MSWRILQISKPCRLSVKAKQLVYEPVDMPEEKITLPLEDISVIILENRQISLNNSLISELAEYNIVLFTCDFSHTPSGVFIPFHSHSRYSEIAWQQIETTEPLKKRLWQNIVRAKILNQSECLKKAGRKEYGVLEKMISKVQSGDTKNHEAYAAGIYWKNLFDNFRRHDEDITNSALNYGYAILRGAIARFIVGAGLLPCFGVHHANKLNAYNLADDIIEPFRPFIDYMVYNSDLSGLETLTPETKQKLVSILTVNCSLNDEEITVLKACELVCISMAKAVKTKDSKTLVLPQFSKMPLFE